ncbi:MAG TPA: hypothetical protein VGG03_16535 [Thermoanaerobaculia bacterium]|jgi:hypothetical protein
MTFRSLFWFALAAVLPFPVEAAPTTAASQVPDAAAAERFANLAWLLQLAAELHEGGDPQAKRWAAVLSRALPRTLSSARRTSPAAAAACGEAARCAAGSSEAPAAAKPKS